MRINSVILGCLLACGLLLSASAAETRRPAILFCAPQGLAYGGADLTYLEELSEAGFQVDYTQSLSECTRDRLRKYNVLVINKSPGTQEFADRIERFAAEGGGVFFVAGDHSHYQNPPLPLLEDVFDFVLPLEKIEEPDTSKTGALTQASRRIPLALTRQIEKTPVSKGIEQVWYPLHGTNPVLTGDEWQPVLRTSETAYATPYKMAIETASEQVRKQRVWREGKHSAPVFMAIREYGKGRVAVVNQWKQFSIGAGTRFIYNREVLSKGVNGIPSDFGTLLRSTYEWLAEPSLATNYPGGFRMRENTLVPENQRPQAKRDFEYTYWFWEYEIMDWHGSPDFAPVWKGIIGPRTIYSSGSGTVAEYAEAARETGLDFIVFLEDLNELTKDEYDQLVVDCEKLSSDRLMLIPGVACETNLGLKVFAYGEGGKRKARSTYPPENVLGGSNEKVVILSEEADDGKFTGNKGPGFEWLISFGGSYRGNAGFYHFTAPDAGMGMTDLRLCGAAALRYYRDGNLVESLERDHLLAHQGTLGFQPVAVNEVESPEAMKAEVHKGHALTYAQARSRDTVIHDALRWNSQFDGLNVFVSDGPVIHAWPVLYRTMTMGAENFVVQPNIMKAWLDISSDEGLKEIRIYNGGNLFRRIDLDGDKRYVNCFLLNAEIHKNLVVVAEDQSGGKAISMARRCWGSRGRVVVFCGDHVNDCKSGGMLLGRGPNSLLAHWPPPLPQQIAGFTWDGGPPSSLPLVAVNETRPHLISSAGEENGGRFTNIPLSEFSDGGVVAVTSFQHRFLSDHIQRIRNPWRTWGPVAGESELMSFKLRYREWYRPTIATPDYGWAGKGVYADCNASLFRGEITFRKDQIVESLTLVRDRIETQADTVKFAWGRNPGKVENIVELAGLDTSHGVILTPGDWFAFFSPELSSTHLFVVRRSPLELTVWGKTRLQITAADMPGTEVKKGDEYAWELFSVGAPVSVPINSIDDVLHTLKYLARPDGLEVRRGTLANEPGVLEITPQSYAAEVRITRPAEKTHLTVPMRVSGLNRNWTAGLWLNKGYVKGTYGEGKNRYRPLGLDDYGYAYVPLYVDRAPETHVLAGHPVVAGGDGKELFIQVTLMHEKPHQWHVAVNNPTDRPITTQLSRAMDLPKLTLPDRPITLQPGEYRVVR